ncbi:MULTISPECIES: hypothetical protein [unclassified Mesorhizobium]|uniref:hypothetical protein n=1 Tax=unclassified Mesorhizobium TaxID=325217 RepID=UPI0010935DE5|nr:MULTISPECIES: hypothetical protein [unclassified Mesorhizobium]TGT91717.1 hypothetical protein EN804_01185 [Mesorhizobium sp. M8A.F.Ca.ET.161.01.1.1]TGV44743.1 hypothetical protein EN785_01180 [Mesorhizobium sp. M8A.F.Ca.ET.142.01.1.1]
MMDGKDKKTGRFLPGNKLGGRAPGAISHRRRALEHLTKHGDAIITTAITAALAGDTQLLSLLVKLLVPTGGIPAEIPNGDPVQAYAEGEINSSELRQLMTSVEKARQLDAIHKGDSRSEPQRTTILVDEDAAEVYRRMIET